ncbi:MULTISPECIES: MopE-related protein [Sandaracinus]|uniref:MopE-related protein n=1 Tax=Sandaracinus TaxID=1055688 RepID=UPI0019D4B187|nr:MULTISPECIES: MopE-related protein [Sandaracinus]
MTSSLAVPAQVDALEVRVVGTTASSLRDQRFALTRGFPHTFDILPGAAEHESVQITIVARRGGSENVRVLRRVVRAAFVSGTVQDVSVELSPDCIDVECPEGIDCVLGTCERPIERCEDASQCDDGIDCTVDRCEDMICRHDVDSSICEVGTTCDPIDGCPGRACLDDVTCDDGAACNGEERCVDGRCAPGTAIDCDDRDECTTDRCQNELNGECAHVTRDADADGHGDALCPAIGGASADDCNDSNVMVFPGSPETCNGLDDDCDQQCDQEFECCRGETRTCSTACGTVGVETCTSECGWSECTAPAEACNAVDDDCDGSTDEDFGCVPGETDSCRTLCGSTGQWACSASCTWGPECAPPVETCNGVDDDCDAVADDGFNCARGSDRACTTSCGTPGREACLDGCGAYGACVAIEGCNGVDDDCDSRVDETVECAVAATERCTTTCGSQGTRRCDASCRWESCEPPAEICNGEDEDCDGAPDDGFTCVPGSTRTCATNCGTTGVSTCTNGCEWGACTPPPEVCNGRDDNCTGGCDETSMCCAGSTVTCETTCGSTGTYACSGTCTPGACIPPAETCNGLDDDCDGTCDNGSTCCAGRVGTCVTSCGSSGTRVCSATCGWPSSCTPPSEICNGQDDDCDGVADDGFGCIAGTTAACTTSCGTAGTRSCGATCTLSATCTPPGETCNGFDDNCDGVADDGCSGCVACSGATSVTGPGGRYSLTLSGSGSHTGSCGSTGGPERTLTLTLGSASDVFITTHAALGVNTTIYVRRCACGGTEVSCNDDADGLPTSMLHLTNLAAGTYQLFVDTPAGTTATVPVDIYVSPVGTESDRCGNPTFVPLGSSTRGTTVGFTHNYDLHYADGSDCPYAGSGNGPDRVFYFVVPSPQTLTVSGYNSETDFDAVIYLRSICENPTPEQTATNQLACADDVGTPPDGTWGGCAWQRPTLTRTFQPGLYYVFVDSGQLASCQSGPFRLDVGP